MTLTARVGNTCLLAFRGTSMDQKDWMADWKANFVLSQVTLVGQCTVTEGMRDAYFVDYVGHMEEDIRVCMEGCPECTLVITGHSQGGSIANVAGVLFESYGFSPYVLTFGQPKVLGGRCKMIHASKWFRFILAEPGLFRLRYDIVPLLPGTGTFYGHEILVSRDDLTGVEYIGLNTHAIKGVVSSVAHRQKSYMLSMLALRDNGFPIRTTGFRKDAKCSKDHECASGTCAWRWFYGNKCT